MRLYNQVDDIQLYHRLLRRVLQKYHLTLPQWRNLSEMDQEQYLRWEYQYYKRMSEYVDLMTNRTKADGTPAFVPEAMLLIYPELLR